VYNGKFLAGKSPSIRSYGVFIRFWPTLVLCFVGGAIRGSREPYILLAFAVAPVASCCNLLQLKHPVPPFACLSACLQGCFFSCMVHSSNAVAHSQSQACRRAAIVAVVVWQILSRMHLNNARYPKPSANSKRDIPKRICTCYTFLGCCWRGLEREGQQSVQRGEARESRALVRQGDRHRVVNL
jgi:hypothetical protein